jgi:hypothetical protein
MRKIFTAITSDVISRKVLLDLLAIVPFLIIVSIARSDFGRDLFWLWLGGIFGIELLPIAEKIFQPDLTPARPIFRTFFFQGILIILSFYVLSSSRSLFGIGMVMTMSLKILKDQLREFSKTGMLSEGWFLFLRKEAFSYNTTRNYLIFLAFLFLILTLFLLRS